MIHHEIERIAEGLSLPLIDADQKPVSGALTRLEAARLLRQYQRALVDAGFILRPNWQMETRVMQSVRLVVPEKDGLAALALFAERDGWRHIKGRAVEPAQPPDGAKLHLPAQFEIAAVRRLA